MKSYIAKTTINFVDFEFYIRPGDLLVHDSANHNRLTVYRNGQIVKIVKQNPLGVIAFLKNKFIEEIAAPLAAQAPVEAPKGSPTPLEAVATPVEPKKPAPVVAPAKLEPRPESKPESKAESKPEPKVEELVKTV